MKDDIALIGHEVGVSAIKCAEAAAKYIYSEVESDEWLLWLKDAVDVYLWNLEKLDAATQEEAPRQEEAQQVFPFMEEQG